MNDGHQKLKDTAGNGTCSALSWGPGQAQAETKIKAIGLDGLW